MSVRTVCSDWRCAMVLGRPFPSAIDQWTKLLGFEDVVEQSEERCRVGGLEGLLVHWVSVRGGVQERIG